MSCVPWVAVAAAAIVLAAFYSYDVQKIKQQAVERGYAEYIINNSDGSTTWHWKDKP